MNASPRGIMNMPEMRTKAERSLKVAMKDISEMPTDLGMLDGTFIMPSPANRPSYFTAPRDRLKMAWHRIKRQAADLISVLIYKRLTKKPRPKLNLRKTAPTALALHRQMYTAFAEGDTNILRQICADGLLESFRARIGARRGEKWQWKLHRYSKSTRVMSNRAAQMPIEGAGFRQAVVRIQSIQSLTRIKPDGQTVSGTGQEKEIREYVVIQKRLWKGKEGPWIVWGTTEETTIEKIRDEERRLCEGTIT
ncbi:MAG: hypothetical protein M1827_007362 [Pycnora praestabilis]|nr:MAG: hypothetical protein M1827_007362 [Pycnora praestabilis]